MWDILIPRDAIVSCAKSILSCMSDKQKKEFAEAIIYLLDNDIDNIDELWLDSIVIATVRMLRIANFFWR